MCDPGETDEVQSCMTALHCMFYHWLIVSLFVCQSSQKSVSENSHEARCPVIRNKNIQKSFLQLRNKGSHTWFIFPVAFELQLNLSFFFSPPLLSLLIMAAIWKLVIIFSSFHSPAKIAFTGLKKPSCPTLCWDEYLNEDKACCHRNHAVVTCPLHLFLFLFSLPASCCYYWLQQLQVKCHSLISAHSRLCVSQNREHTCTFLRSCDMTMPHAPHISGQVQVMLLVHFCKPLDNRHVICLLLCSQMYWGKKKKLEKYVVGVGAVGSWWWMEVVAPREAACPPH